MAPANKAWGMPARLWMNWPLWGGALAMLLLSRHVWVVFAPAQQAVPPGMPAGSAPQAAQLFGTVDASGASAALAGMRPIGIFASRTHGFAVMQTAQGQVGVGVGELVAPGVRLVETHADYVVLERDGVRQRADLSSAPAATQGIQPALPRPDARQNPAQQQRNTQNK